MTEVLQYLMILPITLCLKWVLKVVPWILYELASHKETEKTITHNNSHENWENSILAIKKARKRLRLSLKSKKDFQIRDFQNQEDRTHRMDKLEQRNNKSKQYEHKWQSLTCSGTIKSKIYDSNLFTTTSHWLHQLHTVGIRQCNH